MLLPSLAVEILLLQQCWMKTSFVVRILQRYRRKTHTLHQQLPFSCGTKIRMELMTEE